MNLPTFNIKSTNHLSILLFGGYVEVDQIDFILDEDGKPLYVKSGPKKGELRIKKTKKLVYVNGLGLYPQPDWKTKKEGIFQVNNKVLSLIAGQNEELEDERD